MRSDTQWSTALARRWIGAIFAARGAVVSDERTRELFSDPANGSTCWWATVRIGTRLG